MMKKPKAFGGPKPRGMKSPASPAGSGAGPASAPGKAGGAISLKPPVSIKGFGHAVPEVKPLTTDRGSFKIKG
jgi:hypothetical protein